MISCPRCGAATAPGKFCAQCGAPLQAPFHPQPARKPRTGLIIGLAAGGVALLGLIGLGIFAAAGDSAPTPSSSAPATSQPAGQPATGASKTAAKPGWVTGTVSDAAGRPLTVARDQVVVRVTGDLKDGQAYKGIQPLDANWRFAAQVPAGSFTAAGFVKVNFAGKEFWLPLDPVGGPTLQDSAKGVVKDLQWKLSGVKAGQDPANPYSYYGSFIFMLYQGGTLPDGAKVTFTATPLTPLADGSQGKPLTFQATAQELKKGKNLIDIPLARYQLTGEVTMPDGSRKKALISGATGPATPAQEFTFTPNSMGEGLEGVSLWMMGEQ